MNSITCQVIGDLLPLYEDQMLSEDSRTLVEEHLSRCPRCAGNLAELQKAIPPALEDDGEPLRIIKRKLNNRRILTAALTASVMVGVMVLALIHMTAPIPLPYDQGIAAISRLEGGAVLMVLGEDVAGYSISSILFDDETGEYAYSITAWASLWNRYFGDHGQRSLVVNDNADGGYDPVSRIYYYSVAHRDGPSPDDVLIYEDGQTPSHTGGVVTLPRLALSYYWGLAVILLLICIPTVFALRKNSKAMNYAVMTALLPLSYILSQLCVKGTDFATHTLIRDFTGILLLMIPIYAALLLMWRLWRRRRTA